MSIASEIQTLNTNLTSAKNAVTTKGGTVGDTGLAGLATEIESIPSGGTPSDDWGTVTYLDSNDQEQTVTIQNESEFLELSPMNTSTEYVIYVDTVKIGGLSIDPQKITRVALGQSVTYIPDNFLAYFGNISSFSCSGKVTGIGKNFMSGCGLFNQPISFPYAKVVGDRFLYGASEFNSTISLPEAEKIGSQFLGWCAKYNQPISLPKAKVIGSGFVEKVFDTVFNSTISIPSVEMIDSDFLYGCTSFNQNLTLPSSVSFIGFRFMQDCDNMTSTITVDCSAYPQSSYSSTSGDNKSLSTTNSSAAMYTTGITLAGTHASDWKTALPDRTSSPYRKLILG